MVSNQDRLNINTWNKAGILFFMAAAVAVLVWTISMWESPLPQSPPRVEAPQVETTLHDAGEGVTCWVLRRGETILGSGCLR
jgi:predicted small integral membrane protein